MNLLNEVRAEIRKSCATTEIQQPYMLCEQHKYCFYSVVAPPVTLLFTRAPHLEHHSTTCTQRVKKDYHTNINQIPEIFFDKLDSFGIIYTSEQKVFKTLATFDFEKICVQEQTFEDTNATTWIWS